VHSALRRQEQRLPFAERITAAELLEALEVQKALIASGVDVETALAAVEAKDQSNIASFDLSGKGPRK
jgi:predicted NACHT family NTPase